jgi:mRNA interferase RelE/StbE
MTYQVKFPDTCVEKKFQKMLAKISHAALQEKIMLAVEGLSSNPRPYGRKVFKKINPPVQFYQFTAQYRLRIGDYRVLYDIDDNKKIVWILALRVRCEKTYR